MKFISLVLTLLHAQISHAQTCDKSYDLRVGFEAPCSGVLIPELVLNECISLKIKLVPELELRISHLEGTLSLERKDTLDRLSACDEECESLRRTLSNVTSIPPGPDPVVVGVVTGLSVALAIAIAWISVEATR